jgi:predicted negative regulator of RcsB-dependent stress response
LDKLNAETEQQKREAADRERVDLLWFDNIINWAIILLLIGFIFLVGYYAYESYNGGPPEVPAITISTKPTR